MTDRYHTALYVTRLTNVTLRGLTTVYAEPPTNQALIVDIAPDGTYYDVEVPQGWPLNDWGAATSLSCNIFTAEGTRFSAEHGASMNGNEWCKPGTSDISSSSVVSNGAGPRSFRVTWNGAQGPPGQQVAAGDYIGCRLNGFAFTWFLDGVENCTLVGCSILGGPGFGLMHSGRDVAGMRGGTRIVNLAIIRPPPPANSPVAPLLSTSADGMHFAGVPWGPVVESALLEGMPDDGIAIHGQFSLVTDASPASRQLTVLAAEYNPGDHVRIYDTTFSPAAGPFSYAILSVGEAAPDYTPPFNVSHTQPRADLSPGQGRYQVLTLQQDLPPGAGFDFILANVDTVGSGFVLRGNRILRHRARGMLIKASHGLIVNNTIDGSSMGGIIITPELYWGEADYSHNLTIVNNTVRNVAYSRQGYGGLSLTSVNPDNDAAAGGGHVDISIVGNTFLNVSFNNLLISSSLRAVVENNTFIAPYAYDPWAKCCLPFPLGTVAWVTQSENLLIHNNCVRQLGSFASAGVLLVTSSVTGSDLTNGVKVCD